MGTPYFGTDGIRGRANIAPMTAETAMRVGMAAGRVFKRGNYRHRVVIGKDTRLSGYMLESAMVAGFTSVGIDVFLLGPMPTPAIAMLTRSLRADLGVMISASHNQYQDNGIKLFGPDGYKLTDELELKIETLIDDGFEHGLAKPETLGRAKRIDDAQARYIEFAKRTLDSPLSFDGLHIAIDCANGAAYKVAPTALWELGAEVTSIGVEPDGFNINRDCGSTSLEALKTKVLETNADIGIALDGDADRVIIVDELGQTINGDQVMALIAETWLKQNRLSKNGIVGTVMSNLGLERHLFKHGIELERTKVGDRQVVERMLAKGFNVGGEQSGHIILSDFSTTGDGLVCALQVIAAVIRSQKPVSEICCRFEPVPQILKNVNFSRGKHLESTIVNSAIKEGHERLSNQGRLIVRPSGTEPLIRIMAEGDDLSVVKSVVDDIVTALENENSG